MLLGVKAKTMKKISVTQIIKSIDQKSVIYGNENAFCYTISDITSAPESSLIWISISNANVRHIIEKTKASIIVCKNNCNKNVDLNISKNKAIILCDSPRLAYARIVDTFFAEKRPLGIHERSVIHPEASVGKDCLIGALVNIGKAEIGSNCQIMPNVTIYDGVKISSNVIIHSGSVIGVDGFGYQKNESGTLEKIEHIGIVEIDENVEIGANVSIARAALTKTKISEGTKINNNVHIAHNSIIGKHVLIMANATICGSVKIGDYCKIGSSAVIKDGCKVGHNSFLGMGSVLTKDMPPNEIWFGNPAKKNKSIAE